MSPYCYTGVIINILGLIVKSFLITLSKVANS